MKSMVSGGAAALCAIVSSPCWAQDPTAVGPHAVLTAEYNRGNAAFTCPTATDCDVPDSEVRAEVYYPSDLNTGPFPLVVFLHGRHSACYDPTTGTSSNGAWSQGCDPPFAPIPSYRGYDYIGKVLASHGYIVASISANGINAQDFASSNEGIVARAYLIEQHLSIWNQFNTSGSGADGGPFAASFIGKVDLNNIGTMGHSRGGDGVVKHYARFAGSSPFHVKAVLPIAPTNFSGEVITNVDLGVLLGYCDGDVSTLEGSLFYDRARYLLPNDESTKHTFLSLGSNHNFFNTAWTPECWTSPGSCWSDNRGAMPSPATIDDFEFVGGEPFCTPTDPGSGRLSPAQQRSAGLAYVAAFFRYHLGGETGLLPFLRGDVAPPAGLPAADLHAAYQPPASRRRDLNRLDNASELTQTTLVGNGGVHGAVTANGLQTYERCGFDGSNPCFPGAAREVHWSNFLDLDPRLSRVRSAWNDPTDSFINELPPGTRDVSGYNVFQFRVGVDYLDPDNPSPVIFSITLNDGTHSATVSTTSQLGSDDLYLPPGTFYASTVMNTLRLPLSAFAGVDLHNIQSVAFDYDETANGTVLLSDIAFVQDEGAAPPPPACQASQSFLVGSQATVTAPGNSPVIFNSGTGLTRIDSAAQTGGIVSVGPVQVGPATVNGSILSAGAVTVASGGSVSGTVTQFGTVSLPPLPALPAFPAPVGPNRVINPGPAVTLAPGSYPTVTVNSGGTLQLSAGDYYFRTLTVSSASTVRVNPATRVFVRDSLMYRAPFVSSVGAVVPIFLGYAGSADLRMEAAFDGTLLAPNAHVFFGIGSGITYTGSFFGRILEVNTQSDLVCVASAGGGTSTCSDGVKNGSETDVDCGGGTCAACANGRSCSVATDCTSGTCTGGVCVQPPAPLTVSFETTSNWPGGYCVNLRVTNNALQPTTNFSVTFNTNQSTIYTNWNGTFSGNSGLVTASPQSWNRVIAPGATNSTMGFCANRTTVGSGVFPTPVSSTATF